MLLPSSFLHGPVYLVVLDDVLPSHLVESIIIGPQKISQLELVLSLPLDEISIGLSYEAFEEIQQSFALDVDPTR